MALKPLRKLILTAALAILGAIPAQAAEIAITQFSGLNSQDNPATLNPSASQDLLNVGITPGGKSVYKRDGYGLYKTLSVSTSAIHGGYKFQDIGGNDIQLWGNDRYLNAIVAGATPVQVATGTLSATWDCTDSQGYAYCLTSSRNMCVKTDGTVSGTSFQPTVPLGTMLAMTPERLLVAGVSGAENSLYYSGANAFTNFTVGINDSDSGIEYIAAPGSRITHLSYACGKWLWWKDQSFGYITGTTQYDLASAIISPTIGTLDNSSDYYNGHVYFRGQDNHIYDYDCSNVVRLSRAITPTVTSANRRKANSWTQSSQAEFQTGTVSPTNQLSTTISVGDVIVSSYQTVEYSSAQWTNGTASNVTVGGSSITLTINSSGNVDNNSFDTAGPANWTLTANSGPTVARVAVLSWGATCTGATTSPHSGAGALSANMVSTSGNTRSVSLLLASDGSTLATTGVTASKTCLTGWLSDTVAAATYIGRRVKLKITATDSAGTNTATTSNPFILGGPITFYYIKDADGVSGDGSCYFDDITGGSSTVTSGFFTSQVFDTTFSTSIAKLNTSWTVSTSTPTFAFKTSPSASGPFATVTTSTGTDATVNRYVRYVSSISISSTEDALTSISSFTILARSSGTFYSAVHNAPSLSTWGDFTATDASNSGTLAYAIRASTNSFTILSTTPTWVPQSKNTTITASTGTYFQVSTTFTITGSSQTPTLSDFTLNWYEGTAADKAYIKYFNDYVWIAVSSGTAGTNNRVLRWDLLNQTWLLDDLTSNGFLVDNNLLYFGDPSTGLVYKYGQGLPSDNGSTITAYWKSKNFTGDDPFVRNEYLQSDFIVKQASGTTLSVTYTVGASTATTYTLNLYDPSSSVLGRSNNLPSGKLGRFYSVQFGDTSSNNKWEVLGYRVRYNPLTWRPE